MFRSRERIHHFPYLAPLTVFPLPTDDIVDLIFGPLEYISVLNVRLLEQEFAKHGIRAEILAPSRKPEASRVFLRASRGDAQVELPSLVCEQMLTELMQPACLIDSVEAMLDATGNDGALGPTIVCLADEAATWL